MHEMKTYKNFKKSLDECITEKSFCDYLNKIENVPETITEKNFLGTAGRAVAIAQLSKVKSATGKLKNDKTMRASLLHLGDAINALANISTLAVLKNDKK